MRSEPGTTLSYRALPPRNRRCTVALNFPEVWAVRPNPRAGEYERRCGIWLRERGLLATAAAEEQFHHLLAGEYANWPFPFADDERAEVITKELALRTLGLNRRCWRELEQAFGRVMSPGWMERHAARVAACAGACRGSSLEHRRMNVGMLPTLDLVEYEIGWERPAEVLADPDMAEVERAAADAVTLMEALFAFSADGRAGRSNLVARAMEEFDDDAGGAFRWVGQMHTCCLQDLRRSEALLLQRHACHPMLTAWFDALHCVIYGLAQWHSRAPRYRNVHQSGGWTIQITVRPECQDPF